jgi:prophage DNA circulation protein
MAAIRDIHNVWRDNLVPASFKGALFHVETSQRASGRRVVTHEYPKRNLPYTEDMGRAAIKYQFTGYLILRDKGFPGTILSQIAALIAACESDEGGLLIHPTLGDLMVLCTSYSYSDKRTAGGYVEFDMQFVEAGVPAMSQMFVDAVGQLLTTAAGAESIAVTAIVTGTKSLQGLPKG